MRIFESLKSFVKLLKEGEGKEGEDFIDIDVQGVERTVESIRRSAEAKAEAKLLL